LIVPKRADERLRIERDGRIDAGTLGVEAGERLVRAGLITREELARAMAEARATGTRVGHAVVKLGLLSEHDLALALSRAHGVPVVELERVRPDPKLLALIPAEVALRHGALPLRRAGRTLTVALGDPGDIEAIEDIEFVTRCDIEPVVAGESALRRRVEHEYGGAELRIRELMEQFGGNLDGERLEEREDEGDGSVLRPQAEEAPVIRLIDGILNDAVARGASDVHFECYEREVRVRYRVDGVLREILRPPAAMKAALISRLKILAELNIAERRLPQDGRIRLRMGRRVVDFRVSTLPTLFGEKIVLRILDRARLTLELDSFGMEAGALKDFTGAIASPYGIVLVTGPTGSGKTTTLYSALTRANTADVNIMTAEDPVEYDLPGINQVPVRSDIGMTFAAALRAFLRQDPDIIMVGEIRDIETGSIAVRAALTGRLVLSTLHTNDAPSAVIRLVEMGVEPFNVASAVILISAQRLVRRICTRCSEPVVHPEAFLVAAGVEADGNAPFRRGRGCEDCGGSGYRGRQGLYEVMPMTAELRRMVLLGASAAELRARAVGEGMLTLRMDGLRMARRGVTTLEEVLKETEG